MDTIGALVGYGRILYQGGKNYGGWVVVTEDLTPNDVFECDG